MFRDLTSTPSNDTKLSDPKFFNDVQYHALEVTGRLSSVFSLIGTSFIFITFCASKSFRKPINRLVFYASWGNTLMNTATLISVSGIAAGMNSSLCQAQAFLIQMYFILCLLDRTLKLLFTYYLGSNLPMRCGI